MPNRIINIAMVALTMIAILPDAGNAQESARVRVSAHVVRSLVPETQRATKTQMEHLTQAGLKQETSTTQSVSTEQGFAHLYTERLTPKKTVLPNRPRPAQHVGELADLDCIRITVAYTAN